MRILIDMDAIIVDFLDGYLAAYNTSAKEKKTKADITTYYAVKTFPDKKAFKIARQVIALHSFWQKLNFLAPNTSAVLEKWNNKHEIYIISTPYNGNSANGKYRWVAENLPFIGVKRLLLGDAKFLCKSDLLIDDKPSTLCLYNKEWPHAALAAVEYEYNKNETLPEHTYLAPSYKDPTKAWEHLDAFVRGIAG